MISFAESSFFPIPPDVLLITMGASRPKKALMYAAYCSVFSVFGGLFGYWLGLELWDLVQEYLIGSIIKAEHFELVKLKFAENAFLSIFVASFTPVPYKVFTVTAGAVSLPLLPFITASILGRSLRFFIIAFLLYFFGEKMKNTIEKHFETFTLAFTAIVILLVYFVKIKH